MFDVGLKATLFVIYVAADDFCGALLYCRLCRNPRVLIFSPTLYVVVKKCVPNVFRIS